MWLPLIARLSSRLRRWHSRYRYTEHLHHLLKRLHGVKYLTERIVILSTHGLPDLAYRVVYPGIVLINYLRELSCSLIGSTLGNLDI